MKSFLPLILSLISLGVYAQDFNKAVNDAYLITRMAEKFHVEPRVLNDSFSADFYNHLLVAFDPEKIYFLKEDIDKLEPYRFELDDEVKQHKSSFLQVITEIFTKRITETDSLINSISKTQFNFSLAESFNKAEDTSYAVNKEALRVKLYKKLKYQVLDAILDDISVFSSLSSHLQKRYFDSLETINRKRVKSSYKYKTEKILKSSGGIFQFVSEEYCNSLAVCYDPHTEYFPPAVKENFESELGDHGYKFGFSTSEDDKGNIIINNLKPGSPAYKSGLLNACDKIELIQWDGQPKIDVSDYNSDELGELLSNNNHDKLTLTVKKPDGTVRQVALKKEKLQDDDEDNNKVRSFLLKGKKTIGYILLPAFYTDWNESDGNENGCANDVAKEVVKLKKENIEGLIIDLRYNGGGSVNEAVELSGLFIDAGPVELIKGRDEKVFTLKDVNRGTIYDGPLSILINGYSASASEMFAGTLQDYNRALIVGSPSYGKATSQVILPLDTTIRPDSYNNNATSGSYLKITMNKLYRINGTSAQKTGVKPDIILPDPLEQESEREADQKNVLTGINIEANKYYKPYPSLPVAALQSIAEKDVASDNYFSKVKVFTRTNQDEKEESEVSLNLSEAMKKYFADTAVYSFSKKTTIRRFTVDNNQFEKQRLNNDSEQKEINEKLKEYFTDDPYISVTYDLVSSLNN